MSLGSEPFETSIQENHPDDLEALGSAALCSLDVRRFEQAEDLARRMVDVSPRSPLGYYYLAASLRGQNRIPEALEAIDHSLRVNPNDPDSLVLKARILRAWHMPNVAVEFYRKALAIRPTPAAAVDLARMLLQDSHPARALTELQNVEDIMPKEIQPHALFAEAHTLLREFDAAEARWTMAANYAKNPVAVAQGRARAEVAVGRFELANSILTDLIERGLEPATTFPILTTARKMLAEDRVLIYRMEALLQASGLSPIQRMNLHYALGKSYDDLKDYERAMGHFDDANRIGLELFPRRRNYDKDASRALTNFLISYCSEARFKGWSASGVHDSIPLFVVGMLRSGTTLTESILSAHSRISSGGEQSFWTERAKELIYQTETGFGFDETLLSKFATDYLQVVKTNETYVQHVIDKNPENFLIAPFILGVLPKTKMVHLLRHPVDNLLSLWMTPVSGNVAYVSDRSNLVFAYREHIRLIDHWKKILPRDRFATFSYEELTSQPRASIENMLGYLGIQSEEACFSPENNRRSVLTPSAFQVRQPIHRNSQARWKNYEPWLGEFAELLETG